MDDIEDALINSQSAVGEIDVYFVVDRANYTDEVLRSYCQKILETSEKIWAVSPNVNILLYAVNGNGYSHFDNYGRIKNAGAL